jgi:hypothetical protein
MPALPSSSEINSTGGRGPDVGTSAVRRGHPYKPGLTVKTLTSFDPTIHVKPSDVGEVSDRNGLKQTNFALPRTKSAPHGESVYWAEQAGPIDPKSALHNHLSINSPSPNQALFSYLHGTSRRPLTKTAFTKRLTAAFKAADIDFIHVHGIFPRPWSIYSCCPKVMDGGCSHYSGHQIAPNNL